MLIILVDRREPHGILKLFDKDHITTLEFGDFKIVGEEKNLLVERKTISDMWNSLKSGRLNMQLTMVDILIIEYVYIPKRIDWERIYDVMSGLSMHHPVVWTRHHLHTYNALKRIERKLNDGTLGTLRVPVVQTSPGLDDRIAILAMFPNVGAQRAEAILSHYGNLNEALNNIGKWTDVDGVGPKTVRRVEELLADGSEICKERHSSM